MVRPSIAVVLAAASACACVRVGAAPPAWPPLQAWAAQRALPFGGVGPAACGASLPAAARRACVGRLSGVVGPQHALLASPATPLASTRWDPAATPSPHSLRAIDFGADPTGAHDSTAAIQKMIDYAWALAGNHSLDDNSTQPDLGGLVLDFTGGQYLLTGPLHLPASGGGNAAFENGALVAAPTFPPASYLLMLDQIVACAGNHSDTSTTTGSNANSADVRYRYLIFQNMEFDARHVAAGGLYITHAEELRVNLCMFRGYRLNGLHSALSKGTNEVFVQSSWFHELEGLAQCHDTTLKTGTGIRLDNNDHSVDNVVVFCSLRGIYVGGAASVLRNMHIYVEGTGNSFENGAVVVNASNVRLEQLYFDGCSVFAIDPTNLLITGSFFLLIEGNADAQSGVTLLTTKDAFALEGLIIADNIIGGAPRSGPYGFVLLNETQHPFDHSQVRNTLVDRNTFTSYELKQGLSPSATRIRTAVRVAGEAATQEVVVDLGANLVFRQPDLSYVQATVRFERPEDRFCPYAVVATAAANSVTVVFQRAITNATVFVEVDQSLPLLN